MNAIVPFDDVVRKPLILTIVIKSDCLFGPISNWIKSVESHRKPKVVGDGKLITLTFSKGFTDGKKDVILKQLIREIEERGGSVTDVQESEEDYEGP